MALPELTEGSARSRSIGSGMAANSSEKDDTLESADSASLAHDSSPGLTPSTAGVHSGSAARRGMALIPIGIALTVILAVHLPALDGSFFWDDEPLILDNAAVRNGMPLLDWFLKPFWPPGLLQSETGGLYRPLTLLSYRLDWLIHGENAAGFHATNVLLHEGNALLLFLLARRFGAGQVVAAMLAALWALQPRLTEASAWISGRTDSLALMGVLAAFLVWPWDSNQQRRERPRVAAACVLLFLGLLTKEVAAAGAIALIAAEWQSRGRPGEKSTWRTLPIAATLVAYVAVRLAALGSQQTPQEARLGLLWEIGRFFATAGTYLVMMLTPWRAQARIGLATSYQLAYVPIGIVFLLMLVAACAATWRRKHRQLIALCVLGAAGLLPVLHIVSLPSNTLASDRFLYLPSAALALAGAVLAHRLTGTRRTIAVAIASSAVVGLAWASVQRIATWNDPVAFWVDTCLSAEPANFMPGAQLGLLLDHAGYSEQALPFHIEAADRVATKDGPALQVRANLAESFARLGQYDRAAETWHDVARIAPELSHAWLRLGRMEAWRGDWKKALLATQQAARLDRAGAAPRQQLAQLVFWQRVAAGLPETSAAEGDHEKLLIRARGLTVLGRISEAESAWRALLEQGVDAQVASEGLRFYAQLAGGRHAQWALTILGRYELPPQAEAHALRQTLEDKARESARILAQQSGIGACAHRTRTPEISRQVLSH